MDTYITLLEFNMEAHEAPVPREEIATGPSEPYQIDWESINWN